MPSPPPNELLRPSLKADSETARKLRRRGMVNLSRMGHCAPAVMQTMLDVSGTEAPWLVKLTAGLPGGIGNNRGECGGVTAPLVLLGLRHGADTELNGLPVVVYKGHDLLRRFAACQGSTSCRDILGDARVPLRCVGVVRQASALCAQTLGSDCLGSISDEQAHAYARLHAHWVNQNFHCAHEVLELLKDTLPLSEELSNGSSGFLGGTVFTGRTCSSLTAGIMALGVALGEIENSRLRVLRMIGTMALGGNAFIDKLNKFNKIMNLGHRLSQWFTAEFGSIQCRVITKCDFSVKADVQRYIEGKGTGRCRALARLVAGKVKEMIEADGDVDRVARDQESEVIGIGATSERVSGAS
jgi:hypothetical protein